MPGPYPDLPFIPSQPPSRQATGLMLRELLGPLNESQLQHCSSSHIHEIVDSMIKERSASGQSIENREEEERARPIPNNMIVVNGPRQYAIASPGSSDLDPKVRDTAQWSYRPGITGTTGHVGS